MSNKPAPQEPEYPMFRDAKLGRDIKSPMEYRNKVWKCVKCRLCGMTNPEQLVSEKYADNCPSGSYFRFESFYAPGRHELARAVTVDPPELKIDDKFKEIIYTCTSCGNCQMICYHMKGLEPMNTALSLREWLVDQGKGPMPDHAPLVKSIQNYDNPWMSPRAQRDKWAKKLGVKDLSKKGETADVLFFVGCTQSYDPNFKAVPPGTVKVLRKAGVDFGILGKDEKCCGSTIYRVGDRKNFEKIRDDRTQQLNSLGVKTIVTACAGCHSTLSHNYPDLEPKVVHVVEYVDQMIKDGQIEFKKEINKKVTYHDPCHIGRYSGLFDAPRRILQAIPGIQFKEMERIREWSWCCGAGGGVRTAYPEFATWAADQRLQEAKDVTDCDTIVSACPFCENNLQAAADSGDWEMKVNDVITMVAEAMGDD